MEGKHNLKKKIVSSLVWAFLERCGSQGIALVINIVLARLLLPADYGTLAIMTIFIGLANQFVQNGFNTALIQNADVCEDDYSSVFHVSMGISLILYGVLWFAAPVIASFYETPGLTLPLRVLSIVLLPGCLQSVQTAKLRREMDFKDLFYLTLSAAVAGGVVGILLAFLGGGIWALVAQQLVSNVCSCVVLFIRLKWRPRAIINWSRVRCLFSYGWKLLIAGLMNTLFVNLTGLIIGKKYTPTMLAYYDKGQMLPNKLMLNINDSIQNVMLPALAGEQNQLERCKQMMRRSVQVSCFLIFPMMAGLAAVAEPVVIILLTEKWLPCVPFMQLTCLIYASIPISTANLQAIKALGRSDVFLKLEIAKKVLEITTLIITVTCFDSALAIMCGSAATMPLGLFLNAFPNKKIIGYSFGEQLRDILPPLLLSLAMFFVVYAVNILQISILIRLGAQILLGIFVYVAGAALLKFESFSYVLKTVQPYLQRVFRR